MTCEALTFGVEIDCTVGTLLPSQAHRIAGETRSAHFPRQNSSIPFVSWTDVADHIRKTLASAGFPVSSASTPPAYLRRNNWEWVQEQDGEVTVADRDQEEDCEGESEEDEDSLFRYWEVDTDGSVRGPQEENGYKTVGIEIRSPAYYFTSASLSELTRAIKLLNNTYLLHVNRSTGLHVHVGNGTKGFPLYTMQRLLAFLYAFEPQLNSLHPPSRFNTTYAASLRYGSHYASSFLASNDRRPRALEGVAHFLACDTWQALSSSCQVGPGDFSRLAYRFDDLAAAEQSTGSTYGLKKTVEFRQHGGSVNSEEVGNWVRTVVGIMRFVMDSDPIALQDLFAICEAETLDGVDGATVEPVLAETEFTVLDLLERMGLWESMEHYKKVGLYRIRKASDEETRRPLRVTNPCLDRWRVGSETEDLERHAAYTPMIGRIWFDRHDTSGLPGFEDAESQETTPMSESNPILNGFDNQTASFSNENGWPAREHCGHKDPIDEFVALSIGSTDDFGEDLEMNKIAREES